MWKYILAAFFAGLIVWLGSLLQLGALPGDWPTYLVAIVMALVCAKLTQRAGQVNWIFTIGFLVMGAVLFWGLYWGEASYLLVMGLGILAGTVAVMLVGSPDPLTAVHASKARGH